MTKKPSGPKPIKQRIAEAYRSLSREGWDRVQYHTILEAVFPREDYPRAHRCATGGGPPGCAVAFGRALQEMTGSSDGMGASRTVYLPRHVWNAEHPEHDPSFLGRTRAKAKRP